MTYKLPSDADRHAWPQTAKDMYEKTLRESGGKLAFRWNGNSGYAYMVQGADGKYRALDSADSEDVDEALKLASSRPALREVSLPRGRNPAAQATNPLLDRLEQQVAARATSGLRNRRAGRVPVASDSEADDEGTDNERKSLLDGTPSKNKNGKVAHVKGAYKPPRPTGTATPRPG